MWNTYATKVLLNTRAKCSIVSIIVFLFCFRPVLATWEKFHKGINRFGLYKDDDPAVDAIMEDMTSQQIVDIGELLC